MIISASRRTDIPTFYSKWFERRVQEGFLYVRNPMNIHQVSEISLDPSVVDCIVFWTKNPIPMLKRLDSFSGYPFYFQFTLTGYGKDIEANLPDKKGGLVPAFQQLANEIGSDRVIWRYDPIVFNEKYTPEYHLHAIAEIARLLDGSTRKCVISFVDTYRKNKKAMGELGAYGIEGDELLSFARSIAEIAGEHGMSVATCAEVVDLSQAGIEHNCCIDPELIASIVGNPLKVGKDKTQRQECGCVSSIDIGSYNTCANGCRYCYANFSQSAVDANMANHDWESPLLYGHLEEGDKVTKRKMSLLAIAAQPDQLSLLDL